jgi:hypothetical protein
MKASNGITHTQKYKNINLPSDRLKFLLIEIHLLQFWKLQSTSITAEQKLHILTFFCVLFYDAVTVMRQCQTEGQQKLSWRD